MCEDFVFTQEFWGDKEIIHKTFEFKERNILPLVFELFKFIFVVKKGKFYSIKKMMCKFITCLSKVGKKCILFF